jgi:hypothetical protein
MAKRTCQSSEDLKQIWRRLLPDTPFPACEPTENAEAETAEDADRGRADQKPPLKPRAR